MTEEKKEKKSGNEYLFEIAAFLITSAKIDTGADSQYDPFRLIETLYKLSFLPEYLQELKEDKFIIKVRKQIDELYSIPDPWKTTLPRQLIKKLSSDLIKEIKKRKDIT